MATRPEPTAGSDESGFSLIETMIAMAILATGLLSMARRLRHGPQPAGRLLGELDRARESARGGRERPHGARHPHAGVVPHSKCWHPDRLPGRRRGGVRHRRSAASTCRDSTVSSTRPTTVTIEVSLGPGPDGILGTTDDTRTPMINYTRQIEIAEHSSAQWAGRTRTCAG